MKAVAADDEVAVDAVGLAVLLVAHPRCRAAEVARRHVPGVVDGDRRLGFAQVHQVARQLGLAIDGDPLASGQPGEVDAVGRARQRDLDTVMRQPLGVQPRGAAGPAHQIHRPLFEHAGPDPPENIVAVDPVEDHRLDPGPKEQLPQQQARGTRSDDHHLGAHAISSRWPRPWPRG